jgi:outer membrane beta-barrel protein
MFMQKRLAFFIAISICALPLAAQAQRKSPLADAPAVRKRLELRSARFEVGAGGGSTINQDFFHSMVVDVKAGFHIVDSLAISAFGAFTVANIESGFQSRVTDSLKDMTNAPPRQPSPGEAQASMNKITQMFGAQLEWTPFTGKYSLFGKLFAHYDFYLFGGAGAINLAASSSSLPACTDKGLDSAGNPIRSCAVTGIKPGPTFGVGIHSFINQFVALNLELRDIVAQNNSAGRDVNGDGRATTADLGWEHTVTTMLNVTFLLPAKAEISN